MPIADWTVDFELTSWAYAPAPATLPFNQTIAYDNGDGIFLLRPDGCKLRNNVRAEKEDVPQDDGAIMHCRYVGGMEMDLAIQLWEGNRDRPACDALLQEMLDDLMGYLYNLINSVDNGGRIQWTPTGASDQRMLDDLRLLTYPDESHPPSGAVEIGVTVDTAFPYAMNLTPSTPLLTSGGTPTAVTVLGNRPNYPVWRIYGPGSDFNLVNFDTDEGFSWDSARPGAGDPITGTDYLEINTFKNTVYKNGNGANLKAGIVMENSEFFTLSPGTWDIYLSSGTALSYVEVNAAWA